MDSQELISDKASLSIGVIKAYDPVKGLVQVEFDDEDDDDDENPTKLVSDWIPILVRKSQNDKETFPYDEGEQVACLYNWDIDQGVCLGALFNDTDTPDGGGNDIYRILFKDGSYEMFDRVAGNRTLFYKGDFKTSNEAGAEVSTGGAKLKIGNQEDSAKSILKDLIALCKQMTFTNGGGLTLVTNNVAAFTPLEERIDNLFL